MTALREWSRAILIAIGIFCAIYVAGQIGLLDAISNLIEDARQLNCDASERISGEPRC